VTDTERLDFLARYFRIEDVGDDERSPGLVINSDGLEEDLALEGWEDDFRSMIDRAIERKRP